MTWTSTTVEILSTSKGDVDTIMGAISTTVEILSTSKGCVKNRGKGDLQQ